MTYRIGIDVGERSVGISAVAYDDDDGSPSEILAAVSHIHDGGMDPDTGKSPKSRLATAGVARRTRRLIRNRRKRLKALDDVLRKHGFPVPDTELPQTHDAWHARASLVEEVITDQTERDALISLAVRHMARHRGWRNPWWSYARLTEAESPSEHLLKTIGDADVRYSGQLAGVRHLGQLVSRVANKAQPIRLTKNAQANPVGALLAYQVRQEDTLAELRAILDTQEASNAAADALCEAVFFQAKPHIPKDRIGTCALQPGELRAPTASLAFQEFRVRDAVGNLRVGKEKRRLTADEHDKAIKYLLTYPDEQRPRWRDLAEHLGLSPRDLIDSSIDGAGATSARYDRTSATVTAMFKKSSPIGQWWLDATRAQRAELINIVTDLSGEDGDIADESLAMLLSRDDVIEPLDKLNGKLESGRAAYSESTLVKLNDVMREQRCDLHDARKIAFGVDDDWKPPRPSFDDPIEHPTVARVNTLVRRFLMTAVNKWGMPDRIVVEHVRDAFVGPTALADIKREIRLNTLRKEQIEVDLKKQGVQNVTRQTIRRNEFVQRQNSVCLYCGKAIGLDCELDHIVPRAGGGSSRRDNLVAVCRECNLAKGKTPFAVWAPKSGNPDISVEAAQLRVKGWQKMGMTVKSFARLKGDVSRRLAMTADDEIDERSLESTAYAAREMRARIETFLDREAERLGVERGTVMVFSGTTTSEARKAGGIDDRIQLRDFTRKSRFDRRHHAVDSIVLTSLDLGVAKTLRERANLNRDNRDTGKYPDWKDYRGATPGAQDTFANWRERVQVLAELIETAIRDDRIAVARPLRLSPRVGAVHADTIEPLVRRSIGDAFTQAEILRIVDRSLFMRMSELAAGGDLDEDPGRSVAMKWAPDRPVALFPSNAAYLKVRGGAVAIGGTIKSAQVYAWKTKTGFGYGMVRIPAGELAKLGLAGSGKNVLTDPLPMSSQAMRTANATVVQRIQSGEARFVGWITVDDEVAISPTAFLDSESKLGEFLRSIPEPRWTLTGFYSSREISVAPSYLAHEGVVTEEDSVRRGSESPTPAIVADVLKANRIPLGINVVFGADGTEVIRRTVTGAPRWKGDGLPVSWNVREAAERAFSE